MRPKEPVLLLDMDGILADIWTPWFYRYNNEYNDTLSISLVKDFVLDFDHLVKPECGKKFFKYLTEDFYRNLLPLEGAISAVHHLAHVGFEIKIATALPWKHLDPGVAKSKVAWLNEHLPFLDTKNIHILHHKHYVPADAFVDDWPLQLKNYRAAHPHAVLATIHYPYNTDVDRRDVYLADNWYQITDHLRSRFG